MNGRRMRGSRARPDLRSETIAALKGGVPPRFAKRDEEIVYGFAHQLVSERGVSDARYEAALSLLGEARLVELVGQCSAITSRLPRC